MKACLAYYSWHVQIFQINSASVHCKFVRMKYILKLIPSVAIRNKIHPKSFFRWEFCNMLGLVNLVVWWIDILACTVNKPNCLLQFVADGVFKAELNNFLTRELAEDGYSGVEVRVTPTRTEIIILATRTQNVLGEKGRRIRELTSVVQKRFNFPEGTVEVIIFYSLQNWMTFIIF